MHNNLKLISLLALFISAQSFGQLNDLSMLGIDANNFTQTSVPDSDVQNNENRDSEIVTRQDVSKEEYEDDSYGYSGGASFKNPPQKKLPEGPLEYFGYSYFSNSLSPSFSQPNVPVPPNYLIGPDDTINIILYGNKNRSYQLKVSRDGEIFFPEIGPLAIAGLTFGDVKDLISSAISSKLIGTNVSLTLGSLRTIDVFILGAAKKPGMYSISALSNITNAIFESGGIDTSGSLREIKLKRDGKTIITLDLYDLFLNGDTSNDSRLMQGDVIFIEPIGKTAGVRGEVNRPAIYELKESETLNELLEFSGKMKPKANLANAEIMRINPVKNVFELQSVDLSSSEKNINIVNGDVLTIYSVPDNLSNAVLIKGHAQQPGFYAWKDGMRISDIFSSPDDLLEMTDLNYILVKRRIANSKTYEFLQVDLEKIFRDLESEENIGLADQDEILLLPSLLTPDLITTKIIQDEYSIDKETNQILVKDEWTSLAYMSKSLRLSEESSDSVEPLFADANSSDNVNANNAESRFYEYSIYSYCIIPTDFASRILKSKGLAKTESIPIRDLNKVKTQVELESLIGSIDLEEERRDDESSDQINIELTNICRRQLIDPVISIAKSQANPLERKRIVKSFGNLLFPGEYPYTNNMDLEDIVFASGGMKDSYYMPQIEINSRMIRNKEYVVSSRSMVLSKDKSRREPIDPMDEINIKEASNNFRSVEILGEVNYPGTYPIVEGETLNNLIKRAGGIKQTGSFEGTIFTRETLRKADRKRLKEAQTDLRRKILLSISQSQTDASGQQSGALSGVSELVKLLTFEQDDNELLGRLIIDLEAMLEGGSPEIELENKDKIYIPRKQQTVTVVGEVNGSNSHQFKDGLSIADYISLSGGYSSFGDTDNVYIVKSDGSTFSYSNNISGGFFRQSSQIQAGDTIVVPFQANKFAQIRATTEITQIVYQMALAAAAVNSF